MINFVKNKNFVSKLKDCFNKVYNRNTDLGLHRIPPKFSWDRYIETSLKFTNRIRAVQTVITLLVLIGGVAFSLTKLYYVEAALNGDGSPPPAPTILTPQHETIVNEVRPLITGVAESGNDVFILIDRELVAVVKAKNHMSGIGDFYYQIEEPLFPGKHSIVVRARDMNGLISLESEEFLFKVNPPYPSPILKTPVLYDGGESKVTISGLAKNGSQIRIYVNGEIVDGFTVIDNPSGTANFNASVNNISFGKNIIEIDAVGLDGKISSKTKPFTVNLVESEQQVTYELAGEVIKNEIFYEVSESDSLWSLAKQFYGDGKMWSHISYANQEVYPSLKVNPSVISPSWRMVIPTLKPSH